VVGTLDGLASVGERRVPWRRIDWAAACWAVLAKPWFFTGPYLGRLALVPENRSALELVRPGDAVATTSYLAPHLSGRRVVLFPAAEDDDLETLERQRGFNVSYSIRRNQAGPPRATCSCAAARPKGASAGGKRPGTLPAAPSRQQTCQKKGPLLEHWDDETSGGSHRALA
jgi:hypothetical protein